MPASDINRKTILEQHGDHAADNPPSSIRRSPVDIELGALNPLFKQCHSVTGADKREIGLSISNGITRRRSSLRLLGQEVLVDKNIKARLTFGQRSAGIFAVCGVACYVVGSATQNMWVRVIAVFFAFATFICFGALYYKNISLMVLQRLLHETNVIVILILSCCNFVIEIIGAVTPTSSIMGFIYMVLAFIFVLFDVMKVKSRTFVVVVMATFLAINIFNVYGNTFGGLNHNIILLEYTIQGKSYMITKRSTQRSIFIQILLFSVNGIYTMIKDKDMELMIFATGQIYRETGTGSKLISSDATDKSETPLSVSHEGSFVSDGQ